MKMRIKPLGDGLYLLLCLLLTGCQSAAGLISSPMPVGEASPLPITVPTGSISALSLEALKNADYSTPDLKAFFPEEDGNETIQLEDGKFRYIYQSGAATELVILFREYVNGDLDADRDNDSAVLLQVSPGGSGTFVFLAAVINKEGQPGTVLTVSLGDRVVVEKFVVEDGVIKIDLLTQGPTDAMCCPAMKDHRQFFLQNGVLTEIEPGEE